MSIMARVIPRLSAIQLITGTLPLFSWTMTHSLAASPAHELPFSAIGTVAAPQDLRRFIFKQVQQDKKRIFFMGEHHEQPRVLAAQLTMLDELIVQARAESRAVILVLEQFNVGQQGMLSRFSGGSTALPPETDHYEEVEKKAADQLLRDYEEDGTEGFTLPHYMPLLIHARACGVRICGGFPPRAWARIVAKEGVDTLRQRHAKELQDMKFDRWGDLECSPHHAAFLRSMMSGKAPQPDAVKDEERLRGIHAAQAFKDAVLAHTIDREVEESKGEALIMVVSGSGHCEYGFGGPERVRTVAREEMCVLVSKSVQESTIWKGAAWGGDAEEHDRVLADAVYCYDQV